MKTIRLVITFLSFGILFSNQVIAQQSDSVETKGLPYQNSIYIEAFGNGVLPTLNYERLFSVEGTGNTMALRMGGLYYPEGREAETLQHSVILVGEFSIITGKKNLKAEFGFGLTYYINSDAYADGNHDSKRSTTHEVIPVLRLGGRWQKPGKPFFIRLALTPLIFGTDNFLPPVVPYAGISFGYSFGRR